VARLSKMTVDPLKPNVEPMRFQLPATLMVLALALNVEVVTVNAPVRSDCSTA